MIKKIFRTFLLTLLLFIASVNSISLYSTGGDFRVRTVLSPFHLQEKMLDSGQFMIQSAKMGLFYLESKLKSR